jgi:hypothetical protein
MRQPKTYQRVCEIVRILQIGKFYSARNSILVELYGFEVRNSASRQTLANSLRKTA